MRRSAPGATLLGMKPSPLSGAVLAGAVLTLGALGYVFLDALSSSAQKQPIGGGGKPSDGSGGEASPGSVIPPMNPLAGPMLPERGRVLIVGGRIAMGLATGLRDELLALEEETGRPVAPQAITVWDGADVPSQIEATALAIRDHGLPPEAASVGGGKPDVVLLAVGDYNAMWGPVDDTTDKAMVFLTQTFADVSREHFPSVLWIGPWNPDTQPNARELALRMGAAALTARPGRAAMLVPKRLLIETSGPIEPTAKGYREIAHEAAAILLKNGPNALA